MTVATFVCAVGIVLTGGASTRAVIVSVLALPLPDATVPTLHTPVPGL